MKLRRIPEDFQVTELTNVRTGGGPFALYVLTKRSWGAIEALDAVAERWNVERRRISYGGLKDRHAVTSQHITIQHGPRRDLTTEGFELSYRGQTDHPFTAGDIAGNRFAIVLRDLSAADVAAAESALSRVALDGLPNYFDDQRFGSLGKSGEFIARPWCLGNYERALWLAIADDNPHDRPQDWAEKQRLREAWGDWSACGELRDGIRRAVVAHLRTKPSDFRGALTRIPHELRSLYLAAFQSAIWNGVLAAWLRGCCEPEQLSDVDLGPEPVPFPRELTEEQRAAFSQLTLPLPSARAQLPPGPLADIYQRVIAGYELEPRQLRVKYPRDTFFSKLDRRARVVPAELRHTVAADDLYARRQRLTLEFSLPRGSYATILVKRVSPRVVALAGLAAE